MRLYTNKVRIRKRILYPAAMIIRGNSRWSGGTSPLVFIVAMQFILLYFGEMVHGLVISSYSSGASSSVRSISGLSVSNLGAFLAIYSALPHFANAKSIRNGKEVEDNVTISVMPNTTLSSTPLPLITNQTFIVNSTQEGNTSSIVFSSRTLITSEEDNATTLTPSEEMEMNLDYSSEELRKNRREKRKGMNRLKRQMGIAAEIALIAPALQTMGCIPKFFCGMNTKPPTKESSAINDLAYLIKFAMLDDDDVDVEDQLFPDKVQNNRGKDGLGLTRIKEDLILENMAEEELIKEDPGNLPFVWKDMEHRIKTKTKPGSKLRIDDLMDEIIVEPEQTAVGSLFTGIKSVLRIGRSVDHVLSRVEGQANESSQATPRSGRSERVLGRKGNTTENVQMFRRRRLQLKKRPFWATPQFRQDMELAERIGKTEQDEQKCSTTFSVCPYTVHEMMEIVHGGYSKKRKQMKKKNKPQWYVNADGPPADSSEEISTKDGSNKPVRDPENLITTTTEKTHWSPNDPENQIFYSIFPHKAVEQGMTTVRTTKRPASSAKPKQKDRHETVYDIGPRPNREHRKPPLRIQGHAEYENENENDDEISLENKPEHLDMMIHNKNNPHFHQQPPQKTSWFSFGQKGNQRPQRPHHRPPGRRPPHGMGRPQENPNVGPSGFDLGFSREEDENNKSGNDDGDLDGSSEENGQNKKRKKKKDGSSSDSAEDEDDNGRSSEEKSSADERPASSTPPPAPPQDTVIQLPPELNGKDPNIHIYGLHLIENGGDLAPTGLPQQPQSLQPLQPFIIEEPKPKGPISLPRPKYKIVKERRQKKKRRRLIPAAAPSPVYSQQQQPQQQVQTQAPKLINPSKKEDKSNENSDEDGEDDESQENSSEEKNKEQDNPQQEAPAAPSPPPRGPTVNVILHGRPSEELQGPPQQHNQDRPYPGDNTNGQQTSASNEDDLDSDEENANSNSAAMEATSKEISQEMAKIPNPARPPPPHHFRMNQSSEYTYSDENDGHRPGSMRPINYLYFNKPPRDQHNGGPPSPPPQGQQHHESQPPPQTSTQKYSTGFLSFLFGKDKKKQQNHPPPGSMENRPYQHQQQHQNQPPQNSEEDPNDDDDGDDDDDSSEERINRFDNPEFTAPDGKYEVGHLGNKQPPKAIKPNFSPPQKPQRPYRGSTSMEDSDEKRGRSTPAPTTVQTTTTTARPRPVIMYGNPFQTIIPAPATPPQRTPSPQPTTSLTTKKPKKESDEDDTASDEEKPSDESREDDEENSSEEISKKNIPKTKITLVKTSNDKVKLVKTVPFPPIANYPGGGGSAETKAATPAPAPPMRKSTKTKSSSKNRADNEDASDEKQDDSKESKENDEESDEDKSSEEKIKKIPTRPPQKRRKPEDDELDNPNKYPPQLSVAGDIDAVEEILGAPEEENTNNEPEQYGVEEDIPAPPPLALQGFAPSLEIVVPTKAPVAPLKVPPGYPLHEFYQGTNPLSAGGAPPGGVGAPPPGPGAPLAPGPGQQQLAPVHPTSLLGLAQQANNGPNENPGAGQGSAPANQGLRNPLGQTSNRGPGQNNRRPGQQGQQNQQGQRGQQNNRRQQGNRNKQEGNEDSSEENSSEEKEGAKSSEEKEENSDEQEETKGPFDEAIESLGETGNDDDDDDKPEKDLKAPPPPPPIFTGSKEQKQEVEKRKPFLPRPITPQTPLYLRPNPGRREPILKHQLQPTQLLQLQHPQRIRPPPQRPSPAQPSPSSPLVLPMRPSAAANLGPFKGQMRPTNSLTHQFSVSHLLRPLMPQRPVAHRKPLDPKVVQWIRDTYGIPEGIDPNRSGLQSQDVTGSGSKSTTTTKPPRKSSHGDKHNRTKDKLKASSKRKTTTERTKVRGSAEKRNSGEVTNPPTTTTTSTTTTTAATTTKSTAATTTTTLASTTKSTTPYSSLPPPTTTTTATSSTTVKAESKSPSLLNKKLPPDYITEEQEAIMAQKMFSSEEEPEEEEEKDSEEDSDEATTKKYKSKVKSKVGETKLVITIKSVPNNKDKTTSSSSGEQTKVKSGEKAGKLPGRFGFTSAERKKLFLPISRDKLKSSSVENLSGEKSKKKYGSKSSEVSRRKSGSAEKVLKKKGSSSSTESKTKLSTTTLNPKFVLRLRSTPRPKPIKLPPIYGKRKHHIKRHG